jgi:mono/diheme cytochrome c family protein
MEKRMRRVLFLIIPAFFACKKDADVNNGAGEQKIQFIAFDGADMAKGKALYDNECARCHGADGKGDGALGANFDVAPTNFTAWSVPSDERIFGWVRDGGASSGGSALMPSYSRSMSAQDIRDVSAYIKTFVPK